MHPFHGTQRRSKYSKLSRQACTSCRKHKTRCEVLEYAPADGVVKCHRCSVLGLQCSYSELDKNLFRPPASYQPQPRSGFQPSTIPPGSCYAKHASRPEQPSPPVASGSAAESSSSTALSPAPSLHIDSTTPRIPGLGADGLWTFLDRTNSQDWSTPITALQEVTKTPYEGRNEGQVPPVAASSIDEVLLPQQKQYLLNLFDTLYVPWLNFTPDRSNHTPVLELTCCLIASRHMDIQTSILQKMTEDAVVKMIFNPRASESMESIQTLLILSLWPPIYKGGSGGIRDGRLLVASAVSMAMNLQLPKSSKKLADIQVSGMWPDGSNVTSEARAVLEHQAAVWLSLANTESMLCIGTGRIPLTIRSSIDIHTVRRDTTTPMTESECKEYRRHLLGELYGHVEQARTTRLKSINPTEVEDWSDKITEVLRRLDGISRVTLPLPVIVPIEQFYFQMLYITHLSCRLLVSYTAMANGSEVFQAANAGPHWFFAIRARGQSVLEPWGLDALRTAEATLVAFLQADAQMMATVPDCIFDFVGFAAGFMMGSKFGILQAVGADIPGSSVALISRTRDVLMGMPFGQDHAAKRCARLMEILLVAWDNRDRRLIAPVPRSVFKHPNLSSEQLTPPPAAQSTSPSTQNSQNASPSGGLPPQTPLDASITFSMADELLTLPIDAALDGTWADTTAMLTPDFWAQLWNTHGKL